MSQVVKFYFRLETWRCPWTWVCGWSAVPGVTSWRRQWPTWRTARQANTCFADTSWATITIIMWPKMGPDLLVSWVLLLDTFVHNRPILFWFLNEPQLVYLSILGKILLAVLFVKHNVADLLPLEGKIMFSVASVCSQGVSMPSLLHDAINQSQVMWRYPRPVQTCSLGTVWGPPSPYPRLKGHLVGD